MEFKKENIDKIVQYINIELKKKEKLSVNKICDKIGIKQSTFKTWAHNVGYKFDTSIRQYTKAIQTDNARDSREETKVIQKDKKSEVKDEIKAIQKDKDLDIDKLKELIELLEPLKVIVKEQSRSKGKSKPEINPTCITEVKQKLFKVDVKILNDWEKFVLKHKQFKVQNLISLALKEFIDKYK